MYVHAMPIDLPYNNPTRYMMLHRTQLPSNNTENKAKCLDGNHSDLSSISIAQGSRFGSLIAKFTFLHRPNEV